MSMMCPRIKKIIAQLYIYSGGKGVDNPSLSSCDDHGGTIKGDDDK
jgi:hypothetical protein